MAWAYSVVACLSHLTNYHASLSRRSTAPTPNRHLQPLGAHYVFVPYTTVGGAVSLVCQSPTTYTGVPGVAIQSRKVTRVREYQAPGRIQGERITYGILPEYQVPRRIQDE